MSELIEEQMEERMSKAFDNYDEDESGTMNASELANALRLVGLNPTEGEVAELLAKADKTVDGVLTYEEYRELAGPLLLIIGELNSELEKAFSVYDINKDGSISQEELRTALRDKGEEPMTDDKIDELFQQLDKDGDGNINLNEFKSLLLSNQNPEEEGKDID